MFAAMMTGGISGRTGGGRGSTGGTGGGAGGAGGTRAAGGGAGGARATGGGAGTFCGGTGAVGMVASGAETTGGGRGATDVGVAGTFGTGAGTMGSGAGTTGGARTAGVRTKAEEGDTAEEDDKACFWEGARDRDEIEEDVDKVEMEEDDGQAEKGSGRDERNCEALKFTEGFLYGTRGARETVREESEELDEELELELGSGKELGKGPKEDEDTTDSGSKTGEGILDSGIGIEAGEAKDAEWRTTSADMGVDGSDGESSRGE
jgi:hypothetical protein